MAQPSFSDQVLRFILHDPSSEHYFLLLKAEYFMDVMHQAFYDALRQYYAQYQSIPIFHSSLAEYLSQGVSEAGSDAKQAVNNLLAFCKPYFVIDKYDAPPVIDSILAFAQREELKLLVQDAAAQLQGKSKVDLTSIQERLLRAQNIKETMEALSGAAKEGFALQGLYAMSRVRQEVIPSCFDAINAMRPLGGNKVGEHYVLLSGTKAYKTMFAVNLAVGYLQAGYSVYYVDTENTKEAILQRVRQAMTGFTVSELYDGDGMACLQDIADNVGKTHKSDIYADYYSFGSNFESIPARLDFLKRAYGFVPRVIIYDDMDHLSYKDAYKHTKNPYVSSGVLINMAVKLNTSINSISWQLGQINKEANNKDDWNETDTGTSFHKVKISHGVLGMYRIPHPEFELVKVKTLVQREGAPMHKLEPAYFKVVADRQLFEPYYDYVVEPPAESKRKRPR